MIKQPQLKIGLHLEPPLYRDDYEYIEENAPGFLLQLEAALLDGYSPQDIYLHYMDISPHRKPFWIRIRHAAIYLQQQAMADCAK
jgi:hypothetical protein